jgi:hypothetical protein
VLDEHGRWTYWSITWATSDPSYGFRHRDPSRGSRCMRSITFTFAQ